MTEENLKTEETKECKCFCHSKWFKKFLIVALGTFVGFYAALSLFVALHRPPMMPHRGAHIRPGIEHQYKFRGEDDNFHKKMIKGDPERQKSIEHHQRTPFEAPRPEAQ